MMTRRVTHLLSIAALLVALVPPAHAQAPPSTDLWMMELPSELSAVSEPAPVNLTNRPGYDNQPHVTPDGSTVLYTSERDGQTDIYRYDFTTGTHSRVTGTPESEYSPTVMPGGERFSVIRVEADGTQRLWSFSLDGSDARLVLENVAPVGYHAWFDTEHVALFVLGSPPTLHVASTTSGAADTLATNIGRSLLPVPGRAAVSFVQKSDSEPWTIKILNRGGRITELAPTLPGREDLAWLPDGTVLMARGATIHYRTPDAADWQPLTTFEHPDIGTVTRLAVSPDGRRLIFVAAPSDGE